jgi:hypothetical protein
MPVIIIPGAQCIPPSPLIIARILPVGLIDYSPKPSLSKVLLHTALLKVLLVINYNKLTLYKFKKFPEKSNRRTTKGKS